MPMERKRIENIAHTAKITRVLRHAWPHQRHAVRFASSYLDDTSLHKSAVLMRLPTGTGKTGIVAIVANYFELFKNILVVVPSKYLTNQMKHDLTEKYWRAIQIQPTSGPKQVIVFQPSNLPAAIADVGMSRGGTVFVTTPHTLQRLHAETFGRRRGESTHSDWHDAFKELHGLIDLVFVDEGHREPARRWAKAVRMFRKPTILLSATPYRNDLRLFRVGRDKEKFRHTMTYHEAVRGNFIRDAKFYPAPERFACHPRTFAAQLREFFYGDFRENLPDGIDAPKVIIRCATHDSIEAVRRELVRAERQAARNSSHTEARVMAVHERYERDNPDDGTFKDVPPSHDATFWIHQNKLAEGIDDESFCLLAFYEPFGNARSLVQQIGRVLRNTNRKENQTACIFFDRTHRLDDQWNGYTAFESSESAVVGAEDVVDAFINSLPDWFYASGEFRSRVDFSNRDGITRDLRIPKAAQIYRIPRALGDDEKEAFLEEIGDAVEDLDAVDAVDGPQQLGPDIHFLCHWQIRQTRALENSGCFEARLLVSIVAFMGRLVFFSGPITLNSLDIWPELDRISPMEMERLLSGEKTRLKQLSLINSDLSDTALRRKSIGALSLEESMPTLGDHLYFVSTASGIVTRSRRRSHRYVGLSRGRVREVATGSVSIQAFQEWLQKISREIADRAAGAPKTLGRYAQYVDAPEEAQAAHLLIELGEFFEAFDLVNGSLPENRPWPDQFSSTACEVNEIQVDQSGKEYNFIAQIGDERVHGLVTYRKPRFVIQSPELNRMVVRRDPEARSHRRGSTYLSRLASVRIVTRDRDLYADGRFFRPRQPLWGSNRVSDLGIIVGVSGLRSIGDAQKEKGRVQRPRRTWERGSIFHLLDNDDEIFRLGELNAEYLVCDDLQTEIGDFIAMDSTRNKVAVIHAKMCKGPEHLSAKPLQDVVPQVTKNLEALNPVEPHSPDLADRWNGSWHLGQVYIPRIRRFAGRRPSQRGPRLGEQVFQVFRDMVKSSATQREAWIVLGQGFSRTALLGALNDDSSEPDFNVVQLIYLLHSCSSAVSSMGAKLKVFTCD